MILTPPVGFHIPHSKKQTHRRPTGLERSAMAGGDDHHDNEGGHHRGVRVVDPAHLDDHQARPARPASIGYTTIQDAGQFPEPAVDIAHNRESRSHNPATLEAFKARSRSNRTGPAIRGERPQTLPHGIRTPMLVGATRDDTIGPAPGQKELADGHRSPNPVPLPPRKGVAGLGDGRRQVLVDADRAVDAQPVQASAC